MKDSGSWKPMEVDTDREVFSHREPGEEFMFYRAVAAGHIDAVQENCSRGAFENLEGVGRLSDNPVTNLRYHFVVTAAIDYIYVHIRERITINDLAAAICISPTYLSRIFKQETGVSVSEYIRQRKIDMAKMLLRFSSYDLVDIANMLSYSSQSHFIQHFHNQMGMTPKAYRDQNYMNNWNVNREPEDTAKE